MLIALTRKVSPRINECELTFVPRAAIDVPRAMEEHKGYEECLRNLGVQVVSLPAEESMPDAVFIEDTAIVLDEVAVLTHMGVDSRREEVESVGVVLEQYRPLERMVLPATIEGGDVLRIGRTLYVGITTRTNSAAIGQLQDILSPFGYDVRGVPVNGCLHLKTGCSFLGRNTVLMNSSWVDRSAFTDYTVIEVPREEEMAGNVLVINETVIIPKSHVRTAALLESHNFTLQTVDISELQKAEAGLTCLSLVFRQ